MGLFKKIKDIFYDEEIVEIPANKEENQVEERVSRNDKHEAPVIEEITAPINTLRSDFLEDDEEEVENNFSERELFKPEKTFDFPVFDEEEEVKTRSNKTNVLELQKELEQRSMVNKSRDYERREVISEEPKRETTFKPSPVISPVYGILDKNYTKEEIVEKKDSAKPYKGEINYDYVRRKAYGTLEDELEDTLTKVNTNIVESVDELEKEIDELPKPSKNIEELLGQIEKNATVGELEEKAKEEMLEQDEEEEIEEEKMESKVSDNTLEHDLFNLIDSMYEDKEE